MNKSESKYFNTALRMDKALLELLHTKDFEFITVKEICEKAGVNRSTFYLHYETLGDLLNESIAYMNNNFQSYFNDESRLNINEIATADIEHLYLITPQYLLPYLSYIKENKRLFKTVISKANVLGSRDNFNFLFKDVFAPIMSRFNIPENEKMFVISFYINGIIAIIKLWLAGDCKEDIEFISGIITDCIKSL